MTNLIHICCILQYVYYNPLYVSSIICSSSGGLNCIDAASGILTSVRRRPVHRLREFSLNLCTGRPLTESDDTRCCIKIIQPPDDDHICSKHVGDYKKRIVK